MSVTSVVPLMDAGVILLVALALGALFLRLKLPSSIGYLLAGLVLGPLGFGYLSANEGLGPALGQLGVLMVLFYLGMEMRVRRVSRTGWQSALLSAVDLILSFAGGYLMAGFIGLGQFGGFILGLILTASGTVQVSDLLSRLGIEQSLEGRLANGSLVVQDFAGVLMLVFLGAMGSAGGFTLGTLGSVLIALVGIVIVSALSVRALAYFYSKGTPDRHALVALAFGVAFSYLGMYFGINPVIGAYVFGLALAETPYAERIRRQMPFLRELFTLPLFVVFGATALASPTGIGAIGFSDSMFGSLGLMVVSVVLVHIVVKLLAYGVVGRELGLTMRSGVTAGALLLPLGEFAILLLAASRSLLDTTVYSILASVTFLLLITTGVLSGVLYVWRGGIANLVMDLERSGPSPTLSFGKTHPSKASALRERYRDAKERISLFNRLHHGRLAAARHAHGALAKGDAHGASGAFSGVRSYEAAHRALPHLSSHQRSARVSGAPGQVPRPPSTAQAVRYYFLSQALGKDGALRRGVSKTRRAARKVVQKGRAKLARRGKGRGRR